MNKYVELVSEINNFMKNYKNINISKIELIDEKIEKLYSNYFNKPINIKYYKTELIECNTQQCNKCINIGLYKNNKNVIFCWTHALDLI